MAKKLREIVKGVKASKEVPNTLGGYKPKAGDEQKFVAKHKIEKYADRAGNGDDVYNASNVKHAQDDEEESRHGYKHPEDRKVNEAKTCNMTEAGTMCEVHGMSDCSKGGKKTKILREKDIEEEAEELGEVWIVTYGGNKVAKHPNQKSAMRHAREVGGKVSATHGAKGVKASVALAKAEKPTKMKRPWDVSEATTERRDSNIKTTDGVTGGNAAPKKPKKSPSFAKFVSPDKEDEPEDDNDRQKMDSEIETAKHKARLKRIEAGKDDGAAALEPSYDEKPDNDEAPEPKKSDDIAKLPKVGDVRPLFKSKEDEDEHERLSKASMDPEGTTQKFLRGLKDKQEKERSDKEDEFLGKMGVGDETKKAYKSASPEGKLAALDTMMKTSQAKVAKLKSVNEVLSKKAPAGEWIKDFQKSDNPKFAGKSMEKRKQMALAAYYAKQRNEEVEQTDESLVQPLLGSVSGSKKKKNTKEQVGPDTPMTFPNMSVDVNTGRNV